MKIKLHNSMAKEIHGEFSKKYTRFFMFSKKGVIGIFENSWSIGKIKKTDSQSILLGFEISLFKNETTKEWTLFS